MTNSTQKFYICKHCGNIVGLINNAGVPLVCCGEKMHELIPNTSDGTVEKHLPIISAEGNKVTVKVSSVPHPMIPEHFIEWVYVQTKHGGQRKILEPGAAPEVTFLLTDDDEVIAAFAYCNIHGLWKTEAQVLRPLEENLMKKYVCMICGYEYDEELGDPENGIEPGTKWEDLPTDFVCPVCAASKDMFEEM